MNRFIPLAVAAAIIASADPPPWRVTSVTNAPLGPGSITGPFAMAPNGTVYVANAIVGAAGPTQTVGGLSTAWSYVSAVDASGRNVYALRIGASYLVYAIAVDSSGDAWIGGNASDDSLYVTPGAYSSTFSGPQSAYMCKVDPGGVPVFCTYLNSADITIEAIKADAAGNVYVLARNGDHGLTATPGAVNQGFHTYVLLKLNAAGSKLLWIAALDDVAGYSGGWMAVDAAGNIYLPGLDSSFNEALVRVDASGTKLTRITGGEGGSPVAIAVDPSGAAYIAGRSSTGNIFIRKYASGNSGLVYERNIAQDNSLGVPVLAVDEAGTATLAAPAFFANIPQYRPTATCHRGADGYFVRISPTGDLLQSSWFGNGLNPQVLTATSAGAYVAAWTANGVEIARLGPDASGTAETAIGCIANSATLTYDAVAPGEIVSIFGRNLGPDAYSLWQLIGSDRIAASVGGVELTFDDIPAPLLYVQDEQINAIVPWEIAGRETTRVCASFSGARSCASWPVTAVAPAVFMYPVGHAAAVNQDQTINSPEHPAPAGSIISLYLTGLGPMTPQPGDGVLVGLPLPNLVNPVEVLFPNPDPHVPLPIEAEVLYAGPAPFEVAGVYQINVRIPPGAPPYPTVNVKLADGSVIGTQQVVIDIK